MIQVNVNFPIGLSKRVYTLEINGVRFSMEVENDEQKDKEPVQILIDELKAMTISLEQAKVKIEESKRIENNTLTLEDVLKNGNNENKEV